MSWEVLISIPTRMILRWLLFLLPILTTVQSGKSKASEVTEIHDIKDWKKELRTKKNVLALFTKVR